MVETISVRIKDLKTGETHTTDPITALSKFLSGSADIVSSEVNPVGYAEDLQFILNEMNRLKSGSRGVMSVTLRSELNQADRDLMRVIYPIFSGNHNQPIHGENDLALRIKSTHKIEYGNWLPSNLARRFRELREMGYLVSPEPGLYQLAQDYLSLENLKRRLQKEEDKETKTVERPRTKTGLELYQE